MRSCHAIGKSTLFLSKKVPTRDKVFNHFTENHQLPQIGERESGELNKNMQTKRHCIPHCVVCGLSDDCSCEEGSLLLPHEHRKVKTNVSRRKTINKMTVKIAFTPASLPLWATR